VIEEFTAKSGLPTSPKKIVSPVKRHCCLCYGSISKKHVLYKVWPGVWKILIQTDPILKVE